MICRDCIRFGVCDSGRFIGDYIEDDVEKDCPTFKNKANFAEVVHGEWKVEENGVVICSNCGEEHEWIEFRPSYCDMCGAKMDGGKR